MKFKEIKPGMVIHCPKENEKDVCFGYLMERDDLDFTYTNPEDEVGWFFFVCDRMGKPEDMSEEITEFSDLIERDENLANKANDLANSLDNQDNDLDNQQDNEMSAVEVLEKLKEYNHKCKLLDVFDIGNLEVILVTLTIQEIIDKITAYEATKKAPKPVEVEEGYDCRLYDKNLQIISNYRLWGTDEEYAKADVISKAIKQTKATGEQVYTAVNYTCRVKEDK